MARFYSVDGISPVVAPTAFVHPDAVLTGDVIIGDGCYIGPMASLRGDFGRVTVLRGANIQDSCVVHCFPGRDVIVHEDGHVGHGAVLHGCTVERGALIGINSVVMDGAVIGERSFVGANAFVPEGMYVPPQHLAVGAPAKVRRELRPAELDWKANGTRLYQQLAERCRQTLAPTESLLAVEEERPRVSTGDDLASPLGEYRDQAT